MNSIEKLKLTSKSEKETIDIGYNIGLNLDNSDVVLLYGEMGAGKTRITAGIAKGIGSELTVRSPTFVIINEYPGPKILFHCDFYRLNNLFEAYDLNVTFVAEDGGLTFKYNGTNLILRHNTYKFFTPIGHFLSHIALNFIGQFLKHLARRPPATWASSNLWHK